MLLLSVAGVSAIALEMWRIKYFIEQEFLEFFLGWGNFVFSKFSMALL